MESGDAPTGGILSTLTALCIALVVVSVSHAGQVTVAPGSVVRWRGIDLEQCAMGQRSWLPLDDECWYAIDLLASEGPVLLERWTDGGREKATVYVGSYPYDVQRISLEDESKVHLSPRDLRRVEQENRRIGRLWRLDTPRRFDLPLTSPLDPLPEGGRFGDRRFFNDQPRSPHSGADFPAAEGTPVRAAADGVVALSGDFFFSGKSVFVDHGDGLVSMYFHLSRIEVDEGDRVGDGEVLGLVGATGRATGPHLHFGIRWHGARIDPRLLLVSPAALPTLP